MTSQDGGTHVLCFLDTMSEKDTPIRTRLIWCIFVTAISLGLLYIGGLKAIQAAVTLFGFPIIVLLTLMVFTLLKAFRQEDNSILEQQTDKSDDLSLLSSNSTLVKSQETSNTIIATQPHSKPEA